MRRAKWGIGAEKLKSLGIEDIRTRRGMTGAYVLEILGGTKEERESKADALAAEMRSVFAEDPQVRISKPTRSLHLRTVQLDTLQLPTVLLDT